MLEATLLWLWVLMPDLSKEDELKQLKSELVALDRKITAELAPTHEVPKDQKGVNYDENDATVNKQKHFRYSQQEIKVVTTVNTVNVLTTDPPQQGHKPSMVAAPQPRYPMSTSAPRSPARHSGI